MGGVRRYRLLDKDQSFGTRTGIFGHEGTRPGLRLLTGRFSTVRLDGPYLTPGVHVGQRVRPVGRGFFQKKKGELPRPLVTLSVGRLLLQPPPAVPDQSHQSATEEKHRGGFGDGVN
jgi:hypothetical protein